VTLKERRPLVLLPREKPYNRIHLENMLTVHDAGAIVYPPFPSFYQSTSSLDEMITQTVARGLSQLDIEIETREWDGLG
jgi:4-hydroxy-3-polyprenylbenzoate decarboxylase